MNDQFNETDRSINWLYQNGGKATFHEHLKGSTFKTGCSIELPDGYKCYSQTFNTAVGMAREHVLDKGLVAKEDPGAMLRDAKKVMRDLGGTRDVMYYTAPPLEETFKVESGFDKLLLRMKRIHDAKASDYAPGEDRFANFRECEMMGIPAWEGVLVRMSDKFSRIKNLVKKGKEGKEAAVKDESMDDTLMDLAVYSLLCMELRGEKK